MIIHPFIHPYIHTYIHTYTCPRVFCLFLDRVRDFIATHAPPSRNAHTPFLALLATFILLYTDDLVLIADSAERLQ